MPILGLVLPMLCLLLLGGTYDRTTVESNICFTEAASPPVEKNGVDFLFLCKVRQCMPDTAQCVRTVLGLFVRCVWLFSCQVSVVFLSHSVVRS